MGRSVLPHSNATAVAYSTFEPDEAHYREMFDEEFEQDEDAPDFENWMYDRWNDDAQFLWEDLAECWQEDVTDMFPSMEEADDWEGRENRVIARNAHSEVSISEYCGAVAISLAARSDFAGYRWAEEEALDNLGKRWRESVADKFEKRFGTMHRIGGFSDGTSVYRAA